MEFPSDLKKWFRCLCVHNPKALNRFFPDEIILGIERHLDEEPTTKHLIGKRRELAKADYVYNRYMCKTGDKFDTMYLMMLECSYDDGKLGSTYYAKQK